MTDWMMWQTFGTWILGIGTIALAIISYTVLRKTLEQNEKILNERMLDKIPKIEIEKPLKTVFYPKG